jgi:hypothetical protein
MPTLGGIFDGTVVNTMTFPLDSTALGVDLPTNLGTKQIAATLGSRP